MVKYTQKIAFIVCLLLMMLTRPLHASYFFSFWRQNSAPPSQDTLNKFTDAAKAGDKKTLAKLFETNNIDIDTMNLALYYSACCGQLAVMKYLVEKGTDIHTKIYYGRTVLHRSARTGHLKIVKYLVQQGANIEAKNDKGYTPLLEGSEKGSLDCVKYLVEQGANIHAQDKQGNTALLLNINGYVGLEMLKYLVAQGVNLNHKNKNNKTVLNLAKQRGYYRDGIVIFLSGGYMYETVICRWHRECTIDPVDDIVKLIGLYTGNIEGIDSF